MKEKPVIKAPWQIRLRYVLAWLTVRPRRWFFGRCVWRGPAPIRWIPERDHEMEWYFGITDGLALHCVKWPNLHWIIAYNTVFRFFKWLYWDGWRPLCKWDRFRLTFPWYARLVQKIGQTTAGVHISGGECYHCASDAGDPYELQQDETGTTFILEDSGTTATQDGTDHWFRGTCICPKCGYRSEYSDGSL